jgi:hypothetical protein
MAEGALNLLRDRERLDAMREAGRRTAQKRFCASLVVPQYVRYYEKTVKNGDLKSAKVEPVSGEKVGLKG